MGDQLDDLIDGLEGGFEGLAEAIRKMAAGFEAAASAGLAPRTLVLLIHDATGIPKRQIATILDALPELAERYLDDGEGEEDPGE